MQGVKKNHIISYAICHIKKTFHKNAKVTESKK